MLISVIIPTYNPKNWLIECLDSLKKQTFKYNLFEVIIILNGIKNPYLNDITAYINSNLEDLNINLLYTDIKGVSNARNIGIEAAKGDYITFIDDDDYISQSYLENLASKALPFSIVLSNTLSFDDITKIIDDNYIISKNYLKLSKSKVNINKARHFFSGVVMKLIHKDVISDIRFNPHYVNGEDSLFMFEISKNIKTISLASKDTIYYRRNRIGSAVSNMSNFTYLLKNRYNLIFDYTKIYLKNIKKYSFLFFITRILASIKALIMHYKS